MPPVMTEKNTKNQILSEYNKIKQQLSDAKKASLNPVAVKKAKRKAEVIDKVKPLSLDSVRKSIETLKSRAGNVLDNLQEEMSEKLGTLETLQEGIKIREEEGVATMSIGEGRYRQVLVVPEGAPEYDDAVSESS